MKKWKPWVSLFVKPEKLLINNTSPKNVTTTFLTKITPSDGKSKPNNSQCYYNSLPPLPNNSSKNNLYSIHGHSLISPCYAVLIVIWFLQAQQTLSSIRIENLIWWCYALGKSGSYWSSEKNEPMVVIYTYLFLFIAPAISCNWLFLVPDSWEGFLFDTADPGDLMFVGTATTVLWNWETASFDQIRKCKKNSYH